MTSSREHLWWRLARLGRACDVELSAQMAAPQGGAAEPERYWRVSLRPINRGGPAIEVFKKNAVEAVEEALLRADSLGWPESLTSPAEAHPTGEPGGAAAPGLAAGDSGTLEPASPEQRAE